MTIQTSQKTIDSPPFYTVESPRFTAEMSDIFAKIDKQPQDLINNYLKSANSPRYLHWEKLKYKTTPPNISPEEGWYLVKKFRSFSAIATPIYAENGDNFTWIRLPYMDEYLHQIDMHAGGQIVPQSQDFSPLNRQTLITRGIIEEAIASSQLEGAHTTRKVAKEMLLEKRAPRNESEQMIFNNYKAMLSIEENYKNTALTLDTLYELHRILTEGTIDNENQGRLRKDSDDIIVQGQIGSETYTTHIPPSEKFVKKEISKLLDYANDKAQVEFIHPIIKAIFLHFWIGYLHPFTDGNGRIARAIFYWYLLKKGYWTFMYVPISTVIRKAPMQYAMAYIHSEQDESDCTYFFDFHMHKIIQALTELQEYIQQKTKDNKKIDLVIKQKLNINIRQKQLIYYLLPDEVNNTTISSHKTINNISRQTAAKDLQELEKAGLLEVKREGKSLRYFGTKKLHQIAKGV